MEDLLRADRFSCCASYSINGFEARRTLGTYLHNVVAPLESARRLRNGACL